MFQALYQLVIYFLPLFDSVSLNSSWAVWFNPSVVIVVLRLWKVLTTLYQFRFSQSSL